MDFLWGILWYLGIGIIFGGGWVLSISNKYRATFIFGIWLTIVCDMFKWLPIHNIEDFIGYGLAISLILVILQVYLEVTKEENNKITRMLIKRKENLLSKENLTEKEQNELRKIEKRITVKFDE